MFLEKLGVRLMAVSSLVLFGFAPAAMADLTPFDPHALLATGGDATDICSPHQSCGQPIQLSPAGGGIFVFTNNTGSPLQSVDVDINVLDSLAVSGFSVVGTIPAGAGQLASFSSGFILFHTCDGQPSATEFCEQMAFTLTPGPLVPLGGNFVLDLDDPGPNGYAPGTVDGLVASGQYSLENCEEEELDCNGTTDNSSNRAGSWGASATGSVTPIPAIPEPRHYAGPLFGFLALAIFFGRRRNALAR
jgi:hypothetical protein